MVRGAPAPPRAGLAAWVAGWLGVQPSVEVLGGPLRFFLVGLLPFRCVCLHFDWTHTTCPQGAFIGPGNELGSSIPIDRAEDHIFG